MRAAPRCARFCALLCARLCAAAAAAQDLPLLLGAGDYVRARVQVAQATRVALHGPDGSALRHFDSPAGETELQFVATGDGPHRLALAAAGEGTGEGAGGQLALLERLPANALVAPPPPPAQPLQSAQVQAWLAEAGGATPAFWARVAQRGTPLLEPLPGSSALRVTFLWRGAQTRSVRAFWTLRSADQVLFSRLPGTDLWHLSITLPPDTRLSYQLAPDVPVLPGADRLRQRRAILAVAQADPLNPRRWLQQPGSDRYGEQSVLEGPQAPPEPGLQPRPGQPRGQVQTLPWDSTRLGNRREISVYTPAGYDAAGPALPLLLLFDQDAYLSRVPTPQLLDTLIAAGRLPPLIAVLVANPSNAVRARELPCNPVFADEIVQGLLPWLRQRYRITAEPARSVVAGSSYGGLAAAWLGLRHPQVFGRVLSLSGSFWWSPELTPGAAPAGLDDRREGQWLTRQFVHAPRSEVEFFVAAGLFERSAPNDSAGILETSRHLRDVLQAKGQRVHYREFAGGHDYLAWRGELVRGLLALLGGDQPVTPAAPPD